jgi:hypothetical protein
MPLAINMVRFISFHVREGEEQVELRLECRYYFGSNNTDDPTEFEVCAAYRPDGSEYDVSQLQDPEMLEDIYGKFFEENASEIAWDELGEPAE